MAFHSLHFLVFFPIVLGAYWAVRRWPLGRQVFLLAASYYFYMSWSAIYGLLMMGMTGVDFFVAGRIAASKFQRGRRGWLLVSLSSNLGMLFVFKYYNFFADNLASITGCGFSPAHHCLALPLGISFFTFEALSYTIDVYRGVITPTRSLLSFGLFISFFPRMVAGPIIRASHFLPQLEAEPRFDDDKALDGLGRMFLGLFKKLCVADVLAVTLVDPVFANSSAYGSGTLLLAMYGYAFQIYYDFCGYSDIAVGAARMLGFELPVNFNRPYNATSIRDFWRRWHISLSTWLRDYLYVPLGGGRSSVLATARNLTIVMLLGGLWHGAAWTFVIWGAAHGVLLAAGRIFHAATGIEADRTDQPAGSRALRVVLTFHLAAACFVIFRAESFANAGAFLGGLISGRAEGMAISAAAWPVLLLAAALEWTPRVYLEGLARCFLWMPSPMRAGVLAGCLLLFGVIGGTGTPFIYFQF